MTRGEEHSHRVIRKIRESLSLYTKKIKPQPEFNAPEGRIGAPWTTQQPLLLLPKRVFGILSRDEPSWWTVLASFRRGGVTAGAIKRKKKAAKRG